MTTLRRFDRIALAAAVALFVVTLVEARWPHDLAIANPTPAGVEAAPAPVGPSVAPYPAHTELAAIAERPLFTVDRRPYVPPPSADKPTPAGPPPPTIAAELVGIARAADAQVILVRLQNTPMVYRLRMGGQLEGWTVTSIGATTATLSSNGHERELSLTTAAKR